VTPYEGQRPVTHAPAVEDGPDVTGVG
jgi:hypothetical protein